MELLMQQLVNGLAVGSIYALIALDIPWFMGQLSSLTSHMVMCT